jgi:hypothetical protein
MGKVLKSVSRKDGPDVNKEKVKCSQPTKLLEGDWCAYVKAVCIHGKWCNYLIIASLSYIGQGIIHTTVLRLL